MNTKNTDEKVCKCCHELDVVNEKGLCSLCQTRKDSFSVKLRKSGNVDLKKFSPVYCHDGDFMEVTEWANEEGIDIYVYEHETRKERKFDLTYDELEALLNIVKKFDNFDFVQYV